MEEEFYTVLDEGVDYQIRLVVNELRGIEYLHLRKYYLDFDGVWLPTKEGFCVPLTIEFTQNLFKGLVEMLSKAESKDILKEHFWDTLEELYK